MFGFPKIWGTILGPHSKDYSILGSILAPRLFWDIRYRFRV